jgi:hypothetical protein
MSDARQRWRQALEATRGDEVYLWEVRDPMDAAEAVLGETAEDARLPVDAEVIERALEALFGADEWEAHDSTFGETVTCLRTLREALRDLLPHLRPAAENARTVDVCGVLPDPCPRRRRDARVPVDAGEERLTREEYGREFDRLWVQAERGNRKPMRLARHVRGYVLEAFDDSIQSMPMPNPLDVLAEAAKPARNFDAMSTDERRAWLDARGYRLSSRRENGWGAALYRDPDHRDQIALVLCESPDELSAILALCEAVAEREDDE